MTRKRDSRYDIAPDLYGAGMSIADCAEYFGITRQAMHKILGRRGVKFRSNVQLGDLNHFYRNGGGNKTLKRKAQHMVEKAIKRGSLKPQPCEECGEQGTMADGRNRVQAHHDDYGKPLEVRWLCQSCHHEWHKHNTAKGEEEEPASPGIDVVCGGFP